MSDLNEWLKERRTIHDAAGREQWEKRLHEYDYQVWAVGTYDDVPVSHGSPRPDADAIVDAHNTLPPLLPAVEKVLELHKETVHGECAIRFECVYDDGFEREYSPLPWPCPNVRAIEGAIKGAINE